MKLSWTLLILGFFNNLIGYVAIQWVSGMKNLGMGFGYVLYVFMGFWALVFLLALVFVFVFKNILPDSLGLRLLGFFLCTPIPIISYFFGPQLLKEKETYSSPPPVIEQMDEKVIMYDRINHVKGAAYVDAVYSAKQSELDKNGDGAFRRDSVWTYYDDHGKILKTEHYRDGVLLKTVKEPASN